MSRDFFLDTADVLRYLNESSALFGDEHGSVLPIDTGAVMHRQVTCNDLKTPFIEWFVQHVVNALQDRESLEQKDRVFVVSGRAGQGKSTVLRKLFLAILGQWEEEPRERPNFSREMDNKLTSFFNYFQDSTFFAQGRALPVDVSLVNADGNRKLIFIDGLDESTRQIPFISTMISKNPNTVFLLSSRSKYDDLEGDEVINLGLLQQTLADAGANGSVSSTIAHLGELTHFEKNRMFDLLKRFDGHASYGMLESLAKNNSPLLQRPADFLLFRAKKPTTKPQYYIEHLSWLLRREMAKDEDRKERVKSLQFPSFLEKLELSNEKLRMKYNSDETSEQDIESMVLFNLIEQDWSGKNADNYLDITTPASRGLLLLESSGRYSVQDLVKHGSGGLIDVGECVNEFVFGKGIDCFNQMITYVVHSSTHSASEKECQSILSSMLNGEVQGELNSKCFSLFKGKIQQLSNLDDGHGFKEITRLALLIADIFHPVDELRSDINVQPYSMCLQLALDEWLNSQKVFSHCISYHDGKENSTNCGAPLLGRFSWPGRFNEESLRCDACGAPTTKIGLSWFENNLACYAKLMLRISQIGPHNDDHEMIQPYDYLGDDALRKPAKYEDQMFSLLRTVVARYGVEISNKSFDTMVEPLNFDEMVGPDLMNTESQKRTFILVNSILGLADFKPNMKSFSPFSSSRALKTRLVSWLLRYSRFPFLWDTSRFIDLNLKDVCAEHYRLMGVDSMNSGEILSYFLHDGINPSVTYPGNSTSLMERVTRSLSIKIYQSDNLMRSGKFLHAILGLRYNPELESILHGFVTMSRLGHMNPRDGSHRYSTTIDADVGIHIYANPAKPEKIVEGLVQNQQTLYPRVPTSIPPAFHQTPRIKGPLDAKKQRNLMNYISEKIPTLIMGASDKIVREFRREISEFLNSDFDDPRSFVEYYASMGGHLHTLPQPKNVDEKSTTGIVSYLSDCDIFPALIISLRLANPTISSVLLALESSSDGFFDDKNLVLGNYLTRRPWYGKESEHDPNNRDFFLQFGFKYNESLAASSSVPTFWDPVVFQFRKTSIDELELVEDEWKPGHYWFTTNSIKRFSSKNIRKIEPQKIEGEAGSVVIKFGLERDLHQDFGISPYKGRIVTGEVYVDGDSVFPDKKIKLTYANFASLWAQMIALLHFSKNSNTHFKLKTKLTKAFCKQPRRIGTGQNLHTYNPINAWHTIPYFSKNENGGVSVSQTGLKTSDFWKESHELNFLFHLSQDRILEACNFKITKSELGSSIIGLDIPVLRHHAVHRNQFSGGMVELMFDEFGSAEQDFIAFSCSDMNTFPPGLRTIYSSSENPFMKQMFEPAELNVKLRADMFRWTSTKRGALRYAHRLPVKSDPITDLPPEWISFNKDSLYWKFSNEVYGYKAGFNKYKGTVHAFVETITRQSTTTKNPQVNALIEISDKLWDKSPLYAHSSWKQSIAGSKEINNHFVELNESDFLSKGSRLDRVFGFITDTGGVDQYVVNRIKDRIKLFEENAVQLENDERVVSGRANMLNCLRDISTYFTYSNWYPGYIEAYQTLREEFESVLTRIEKTEKEKMGKSLPGTKADFKIVRAVLVGIRKKYLIFQEKLEQRRVALVENSTGFKFNDILKEVRELGVYYNDEKMQELYADLINAGIGANSYERSKLQSKCRPTRKLSVRVLGLSQQMHPYAIQTWWGEAIGALAQDKDNAQVGSLVRLDLKKMQKEGTSKAIVANIGYASEELNDKGALQEKYAMLSEEATNQWPAPLPNDTWLKLGEDISDATERVVPLHILFDKGYAFHPSLEVEIPIFDMERVPEILHHGELRTCTIDVRRDRSRGLYRYYVTHIE